MSSTPSLQLTIRSTEDGIYTWELHDQGFSASGCASTINKCLTALAGARLSIEDHLTTHTPLQAELPLSTSPASICSIPTRFG